VGSDVKVEALLEKLVLYEEGAGSNRRHQVRYPLTQVPIPMLY
jgi:hypothetical protein